MKKIFKFIFWFIGGFATTFLIIILYRNISRNPAKNSESNVYYSIEQLDSIRTEINRTSRLSGELLGYSKKNFNGYSERGEDRGCYGPGLYAIWFPSYEPYKGNDCELMSLGNTVGDFKLNINYIIVVSRAGPQTKDGNWFITDIDGTIYVGYSIIHKLE